MAEDIEEEEEETEKKRWSSVFLVRDSTIRTNVLKRLQEKLLLNERERASLLGSLYDICSKYI